MFLGVSDGHFQQVSFVNSICTTKGGKHVGSITDQVTKALCELVSKKRKGIQVRPAHVRNHMWVFVNCLIENPAFDSQTKDSLTTSRQNFGSACDLDDRFVKAVARSGIVENVLSWARFKQSKDLQKNDGRKKCRLAGVPKLEDANNAGGRHAQKCTLILTEGDSAKALAVSGLGVVGRDNYGVYPLKGKLLNVRDASHRQIMGNAEVSQLKQILGLQQGKVYEDAAPLRYGHVMIMTDQDPDGSHIKGLVINLFSTFWPSLLRVPGFLVEFVTPIVKVSAGNGRALLSFFTLPEYNIWKQKNSGGRGWITKYYKGLGTSTAEEARGYFSRLERHQIDFVWAGPEDDEAIDLAFSKKRAADRRAWIEKLEPNTFLDMDVAHLGLSDFVNRELILFSMASNVRAIPSVMDGLKPGQRKILFSCFKRRLTKEIKVAQLAGYVSENAAYHHGEASLTGTIVNMAQNFCGSNNLNLLVPSGQFGTRHNGGKDAASARYIFTSLSPVARAVFPEPDDALLPSLSDDGQVIEPAWYAPVIPMVLVNGSSGIGTGWSSSVPNYNPRDLAENIRLLLAGKELKELKELVPWYRGFRGSVKQGAENQFSAEGRVSKTGALTYFIDELPVGKWTQEYKLFLESLVEKGVLRDFREHHTDSRVSFTATAASEDRSKDLETEGLSSAFRLISPISVSNMVLFDTEGKLKKYSSASQVLLDFFQKRLQLYVDRKAHLVIKLRSELSRVSNVVRFILAVISGDIRIQNVQKADVVKQLAEAGFEQACSSEPSNGQDGGSKEKSFGYLLSLTLWNLTSEKVEALEAEKKSRTEELEKVLQTTPKEMWTSDLDKLLSEIKREEEKDMLSSQASSEPQLQDPSFLSTSKKKRKRGSKAEKKSSKKQKEQAESVMSS